MQHGMTRLGAVVYYVAFADGRANRPAAKMYHVEVTEIHYRGTTNEKLFGLTYDVEEDDKIYHTIQPQDAHETKEGALEWAKTKLLAQIQDAQAKARCLGFSF